VSALKKRLKNSKEERKDVQYSIQIYKKELTMVNND